MARLGNLPQVTLLVSAEPELRKVAGFQSRLCQLLFSTALAFAVCGSGRTRLTDLPLWNLTDHGPQLLGSEIHPHVCTEATLPTGSFRPVPVHTDGDATSLFPRMAGLLCVTADFRLLGSLTALAHPPPCPALPCPELPCLLP